MLCWGGGSCYQLPDAIVGARLGVWGFGISVVRFGPAVFRVIAENNCSMSTVEKKADGMSCVISIGWGGVRDVYLSLGFM